MKKEGSAFHLAVNAIFIGILLSFAIFYLTSMLISPETSTAETCYDGSVITGNDPGSSFRRAVYQNETTLSFIREYQYRLFGIADSETVIMGNAGFLFELRNESYNYEYLDDFTGNLSFTDEELEQILAELQARRSFCEENNVDYVLVVIPNSQSVYSEYMPSYLGRHSANTRLSQLKDYLQENEYYDFLDLSFQLKEAKEDGQLYHNTENAPNALGMYYAYSAVCNRIKGEFTTEIEVIAREDLTFYRHVTTGRATAQKAGIAEYALNRTLALSQDVIANYRFSMNSGLYTATKRLDVTEPTSSVLLQFTDASTRSQSELFFSNTFDQVTYQTRHALTEDTLRVSEPQVVVQFIYESELARLLP